MTLTGIDARHRDTSARELLDKRYRHDAPSCGELLTLADVLRARAATGVCPYCGGLTLVGLAPDVTPVRASEMLVDLVARRRELLLGLRRGRTLRSKT